MLDEDSVISINWGSLGDVRVMLESYQDDVIGSCKGHAKLVNISFSVQGYVRVISRHFSKIRTVGHEMK